MRATRDATGMVAALILYSLSLGISNVALPLLALAAGYDIAAVGVLTALSAVAQIAMRATVGPASRRFSDRALVGFAAALLAVSCLLVALSAAVLPFVVAELLQGASRGYFWTGSQLHVLRGGRSSLHAIAAVNAASSVGLLAGPVLAGLLAERSAPTALAVAAVLGAVAVPATLLMDRIAPFEQQPDYRLRDVWRTPSVLAGCWASAAGGAWSGLLNSYAPVILAHAGQSSSTLGLVIGGANAANIAGSVVVGKLPTHRMTQGLLACTATAGIGTIGVGLMAGAAPVLSVALVLSGFGAGALLTLGPALAIDGVAQPNQADALAAAGMFRAATLFASPLGIAALSHVVPIGTAVALIGAPILLTLLSRPVTPAAGLAGQD